MKQRFAALCLALCLLGLGGCAPEETAVPELQEPVGIRFDTALVQRGDVRSASVFPSSVTAPVTELYYEFDGVLDTMHVSLGQKVQEGELLVSLDVEAAQKELEALDGQIAYAQELNALKEEQLRLELEICQIEISQMPIPYPYDEEEGQLKLQELETRQTALDQELERQALELSQLQDRRSALEQTIQRSELTAPFDGTVVYVNPILSGDGVQSLQTQVALMDESQLILSGDFVSDSYLDLAKDLYAIINGQRYELTPLPYDQEEYLSLVLSGQTLFSKFRLEGDTSSLALGDYASVFVVTREQTDALYLPINALYRDSSGSYVYLNEDGERKRVAVTVGIQTDTVAEIKEGLQEGDEVYVKE